MYAWKYWHDTRRGAVIYLIALALFTAICMAVLFLNPYHRIPNAVLGSPEKLWAISAGLSSLLGYFCAVVMAFAIGSHSVGSDVGNGCGDYLLSRPRRRGYFVWLGWAVGMTEILLLAAVSMMAMFGFLCLSLGPVWRHAASIVALPGGEVLNLRLMLLSLVFTAAVLYGLTYFLTIVFRSGQKGLITSISLVFVYSLLTTVFRGYGGLSLPTTNFLDAAGHSPTSVGPSVLQIVGWLLFALALPAASQVVLEKSDI